jgi:hypothetical protein
MFKSCDFLKNFKTSKKSKIWILIHFFSIGFSQGDANLLLQYNKGPDLDGFYRKWNIDLHSQIVYGHAMEDYSRANFSNAVGAYLQFKLSKTFALNWGIDYLKIKYQYNSSNNKSFDQISYLSFPLSIRVFPSRRLFFETGLLYNQVLSAKNSEIVDLKNVSKYYPSGVFKNNFGWLLGTQYDLWKRINISIQYRIMRRESDPHGLQRNNFESLLFGFHFFILNPQKKPK